LLILNKLLTETKEANKEITKEIIKDVIGSFPYKPTIKSYGKVKQFYRPESKDDKTLVFESRFE